MEQLCEKGECLLLGVGRDEEGRTNKAEEGDFRKKCAFFPLRISSIFLRAIILIHCFTCK